MTKGIAVTAELARTGQTIMGSAFQRVFPIFFLTVDYYVIFNY
jgi:hypothetical protein